MRERLNTTRPETFTEVRREHTRQQQVDTNFGIGGQEEGDPAAGTVQGSSSRCYKTNTRDAFLNIYSMPRVPAQVAPIHGHQDTGTSHPNGPAKSTHFPSPSPRASYHTYNSNGTQAQDEQTL